MANVEMFQITHPHVTMFRMADMPWKEHGRKKNMANANANAEMFQRTSTPHVTMFRLEEEELQEKNEDIPVEDSPIFQNNIFMGKRIRDAAAGIFGILMYVFLCIVGVYAVFHISGWMFAALGWVVSVVSLVL